MPMPMLLPQRGSGRAWGTQRHGFYDSRKKTIDTGNGEIAADKAEDSIISGDCFVVKTPGAPGPGNEKPEGGRLLDHARLYKNAANRLAYAGVTLPDASWLYVAKGITGNAAPEIWLVSLPDMPPWSQLRAVRFGMFCTEPEEYLIPIAGDYPYNGAFFRIDDISGDGSIATFAQTVWHRDSIDIDEGIYIYAYKVQEAFTIRLSGSGLSLKAVAEQVSYEELNRPDEEIPDEYLIEPRLVLDGYFPDVETFYSDEEEKEPCRRYWSIGPYQTTIVTQIIYDRHNISILHKEISPDLDGIVINGDIRAKIKNHSDLNKILERYASVQNGAANFADRVVKIGILGSNWHDFMGATYYNDEGIEFVPITYCTPSPCRIVVNIFNVCRGYTRKSGSPIVLEKLLEYQYVFGSCSFLPIGQAVGADGSVYSLFHRAEKKTDIHMKVEIDAHWSILEEKGEFAGPWYGYGCGLSIYLDSHRDGVYLGNSIELRSSIFSAIISSTTSYGLWISENCKVDGIVVLRNVRSATFATIEGVSGQLQDSRKWFLDDEEMPPGFIPIILPFRANNNAYGYAKRTPGGLWVRAWSKDLASDTGWHKLSRDSDVPWVIIEYAMEAFAANPDKNEPEFTDRGCCYV
jgi:hypothetical protein